MAAGGCVARTRVGGVRDRRISPRVVPERMVPAPSVSALFRPRIISHYRLASPVAARKPCPGDEAKQVAPH